MEILLWLLPAALATVAAMLVVGWIGRRDALADATDERVGRRTPASAGHPGDTVSPSRPMGERHRQVSAELSDVRRHSA